MKTEMVGDLVGSQIPVYHRMIKIRLLSSMFNNVATSRRLALTECQWWATH